jgi:CyaY protein
VGGAWQARQTHRAGAAGPAGAADLEDAADPVDEADAGDAADAAPAAPAVDGGGAVSGPFWPQPATMPASRAAAIAKLPRRRIRFDIDIDIENILATMTTVPEATPLSDAEYHRLSDQLLAAIEATIDRWLQDDVIDIDSQRTGGLLELAFPDDSRIVINKQPPLHEIWLAARDGGFHYRHVGGRWLDTRDGGEFLQALSHHASAQAGRPLEFSA